MKTYILRIETPVPDYDAWKVAFDSDPIGRERSGVRHYRGMRATDDPSHVMVDSEFDNLSEAETVKAALGDVEFDSASEADAVRVALDEPTNPPEVTHGLQVRINEVVETKEYYSQPRGADLSLKCVEGHFQNSIMMSCTTQFQ
jgi:hypothetical protein